ncbi:DUF58 domain-containing protein [Thermococcus sp. Bubb.Bath]|uniref:DUF58 domain-containing protein n=1 Tax=Thermococcus sp. Bubb.Bath TaxID=1638242 RepID=UPI00143C46BF|nr:DUF58 domain-containing protein [Thermococcus sp. Bubb.Bath]NJF24908.1 DUF58 domain-containing protein [Thermococcus sp. Bubb.Bath]
MNWMRWFLIFTFLPVALAILTGIIGIAYLSLLPASVLAFSLIFEAPSDFSVERSVEKTSMRVGDISTVNVKLFVGRGAGLILIGDVLPPSFELLEGNNRHVFFKRPGRGLLVNYSYKVRALKRGEHVISPIEVEGRHFFELEEPHYVVLGNDIPVTVSPRIVSPRRVVTRKKAGIPGLPPVRRAKADISSTDFKELREYHPGDPLRAVNWKATARLSKPFVNEYEREGQLTIMFYIDASESMRLGGFQENALETAIGLLIPVVSYLLRQNYRVGLYVLGRRELVSPISGSSALSMFTRILQNLGISPHDESLSLAAERTRRVLSGSTFPVVLTNLTDHNYNSVESGLKHLVKITGRRPLLVDVDLYERFEAGTLISLRKKSLRNKLGFPALRLSDSTLKDALKLLEAIE